MADHEHMCITIGFAEGTLTNRCGEKYECI